MQRLLHADGLKDEALSLRAKLATAEAAVADVSVLRQRIDELAPAAAEATQLAAEVALLAEQADHLEELKYQQAELVQVRLLEQNLQLHMQTTCCLEPCQACLAVTCSESTVELACKVCIHGVVGRGSL